MPRTAVKSTEAGASEVPSVAGPSQVRASGRTRTQVKRKPDEEVKAEQLARIKISRNRRLEALESDNYNNEAPKDDEDGDDEDIVFGSGKKKAARKGTRAAMEEREQRKRQQRPKTFAAAHEDATLAAYPHIPTYDTAAAAPSTLPPRQFCSVCGFLSPYTCTQCGARFCSLRCNNTHKETRCLKFIM
eukprot:TRINITY_DN6847_c0_g1_i1.p1 TRINITY_DN6847_c0_g1~~TRINITY_DN6847_c0_g1_i1.p1  ORF type:complete len:195 (+),score=38.52 TRINITY_DN6847_c0_g1_i1:22-585(+)